MDPLTKLRDEQVELLERWLGELRVLADHTWPGQASVVLELLTDDGDVVIAKASTGPAFDHHVDRELRAHRMLGGRLGPGFPELIRADDAARVLVTRYLRGHLVEGTDHELDVEVHRAAGRLLRTLQHAVPATTSTTHLHQQLGACVELAGRARTLITAAERTAVDARLALPVPGTSLLVPTHGDFQPRNWLIDPDGSAEDGSPRVALIDFGRFDLRPWYSDLVRLHHRDETRRPGLSEALREALREDSGRRPDRVVGDDELPGWHLENLQQSLGTVVWATDMGMADFADHGRAMLDRTLSEWPEP